MSDLVMYANTVARPKVLLVAPALFESRVKVGVCDGEVWTLGERFRKAGYSVGVFDGYMWKEDPFEQIAASLLAERLNIIVIHIWKNDTYGDELRRLGLRLSNLQTKGLRLVVIAFGYVAGAAADEIVHAADFGIDAVVTATRWVARSRSDEVEGSDLRAIAFQIQEHLSAKGLSTEPLIDMLCEATHVFAGDSVVSLHASRGCKAKCTFCAYNSDLQPGWAPRPVSTVLTEMVAIIERTGCNKIAFFDNDFGGTAEDLTRRSEELFVGMRQQGLLDRAHISLNVRSECLTGGNMSYLRRIGVRTMLVGLESLNESVRARIFGKRLDVQHLERVLRQADELGIEIVLSYILWHPWQTIESLRYELGRLVRLGRYRVPQFLSRSVLKVVPGTSIEARLKREGHLRSGLMSREFEFVDKTAARMFQQHSEWLYDELQSIGSEARSRDLLIDAVARLKVLELERYKAELVL